MEDTVFKGSEYIWINGKSEQDSYVLFKETICKTNEKTYIKISANSEYVVFINDDYVYSGQYADFPWYKVYDVIDISKFLTKENNEVNIVVWYCGDKNFCHYLYTAGVIYTIYTDEKILINSSSRTKCKELPFFVSGNRKLINSLIGYSFKVDFTQKSKDYVYATEKEMSFNFTLRPTLLLNNLGKIKANKISNNVFDLGKEVVGYPYFIFKGNRNEEIIVAFSERLINGQVVKDIDGRDFSYRVVANGNTNQMINYMRKLGCRYFQVYGNADVLEIGLIAVEYPFVEIDKNYCGLRNDIYKTAIRTLKLNAFEHYFDCPFREQAFYGLDSRFQMRYGYSAFLGSEYQKSNLKLMSEDRNDSGMISITVPTSDTLVIPSFTLFYVVAMQEYAMQTKDYSLITQYFNKIKGIIDLFAKNIKNNILHNFNDDIFWNFYEWNGELEKSPYDYDCALNLTFLYALNSYLLICKYIQKGEINKYKKLYKGVKNAINKEFYDKTTGLYRFAQNGGYYELINSYAILTGVANKHRAKNICKKIVKKSEMCPCTLSMLAFKYDALLKVSKKYNGYVLKEIDKNYSYMLENGATSFWETIKGADDFGGAGSLCHGWSALPVYYYNLLLKKGK